MYTEFKENLQIAQAYFNLDGEAFDELYSAIDAHIEELEAQQPSSVSSGWSPSSMEKVDDPTSDGTGSIFHDVDA